LTKAERQLGNDITQPGKQSIAGVYAGGNVCISQPKVASRNTRQEHCCQVGDSASDHVHKVYTDLTVSGTADAHLIVDIVMERLIQACLLQERIGVLHSGIDWVLLNDDYNIRFTLGVPAVMA
jgi:hypothetical protein